MLDPTRALADMARQVRACRSADGLTLQALAIRSGVAASTIHKVEARQMVPTVSVLLKIAKGLGRRPEELIRDDVRDERAEQPAAVAQGASRSRRGVGVWEIELGAERSLPVLDLDPGQHAVFLVQRGGITLSSDRDRVDLGAGGCVAFEGGRVESAVAPGGSSQVLLIVTPPGELAQRLGPPQHDGATR